MREKADNLLQKAIEKIEQSIEREEEKRVANDAPINDAIKVLQAKQKNLESEIQEQETQNLR